MEQISPKWDYYVNTVKLLLHGGNKLIGTKKGILDIYQEIQRLPTGIYPQSQRCGNFWTEDEDLFTSLCKHISECNLENNSHKYNELISVTNASSGMNVSSQTHVVYASKYPVIVPFSLRQ